MFVTNCDIKRDQILRQPKPRKSRRHVESGKPQENADRDEVFHPVCCSGCATEVGVLDRDEVYHFFNVIPSNPWSTSKLIGDRLFLWFFYVYLCNLKRSMCRCIWEFRSWYRHFARRSTRSKHASLKYFASFFLLDMMVIVAIWGREWLLNIMPVLSPS